MRKTLAIIMIGLGALVLGVVMGPIGWQQLKYSFQNQLIDPTAVSGNPVVLAANILDDGVDYTDSSTWFPQAAPNPPLTSKVRFYTLSIPALQTRDIPVEIHGTN